MIEKFKAPKEVGLVGMRGAWEWKKERGDKESKALFLSLFRTFPGDSGLPRDYHHHRRRHHNCCRDRHRTVDAYQTSERGRSSRTEKEV